jgi:UDP-glucose 4-epimerase
VTRPLPDHGMVRILVTGHRGKVAAPLTAHLERLGHDVVGFDRVDGDDLLDLASVRRSADGCAAIVHAGAIAHDSLGSPEDIMAVNVLGTWHVLLAAEAAGVGRIVYFSSSQVFGIAGGERLPDYFPVDDEHPRRATRAYGLSKCLAEDLCAGFTARTGIPTVALRPAWVLHPGMYQEIAAQWKADPGSEWTPIWEYGAFVDVRDVADAVRRALDLPLAGHHRVLLSAADIAASEASLVMAARLAATVPVRDVSRFEREPRRALLDSAAAARVLGWQPHHRWDGRA